MMFSHDTEQALQTIVALVNTAPDGDDPERLPDVSALEAFVAEQDISGVGTLDEADVRAVRDLRPHLVRFFGLVERDEGARLLNALLADIPVQPRLTDHDAYDWHIHYFSPEATLAEHLAVDGGMALAHVIVADEMDRLRHCEAPDCESVLVDLSRNRSKRYCDASTCGNRLHVAAYRERQRSLRLLDGSGVGGAEGSAERIARRA
jgi:hypothetical protein